LLTLRIRKSLGNKIDEVKKVKTDLSNLKKSGCHQLDPVLAIIEKGKPKVKELRTLIKSGDALVRVGKAGKPKGNATAKAKASR
jgi:hypothetical protein